MAVKKILMVEDNPGDVLLAEIAIEKFAPKEFALQHEECVQNALGRLSKESFDVILLDLFLPDASGLEALVRVHAIHPNVPIIALTGLMDEKTALLAEQMGAVMYFCKDTLSWGNLVKAIKKLEGFQSEGPRERVEA
jgi:DNA-binding response OmpR family regulator